MSSRILGVSLLTSYLREVIENDDLLQDVWIEGEVSAHTVAASGHAYFTLRDDTSVIDGVMWKPMRVRQAYSPTVGDKMVVHGSMTIYERASRYQIKADVVQPAGVGILQLQFEQLRQRLEAEGLFDPARKRPLPAFPRRIGVVTSPTGAVWHDIRQVLGRRYPLATLVLAPAVVQGLAAPPAIVRALQAINDHGDADLIVVARGGGSSEDLAAFNDESLARAIFASRLPVVSAIGHETDVTLADLVADLRAPTPSAAAEMIVPDIRDLRELTVDLQRRQRLAVNERVGDRRVEVLQLHQRLLRRSPQPSLAHRRNEVEQLRSRLSRSAGWNLEHRRHALQMERTRLQLLSPSAQFSRGWAWMTKDGDTRPVMGVASLRDGDRLRASFADGSVLAEVIATALARPDSATRRGTHDG